MKIITILSLFVYLVLLVACTHTPQGNTKTESLENTPPNPITIVDEAPTATPMSQANITLADVEKHSTKEDCWLVLSGKVYDVTEMIGKHPGGEAILQGCGKDATELFETRPMGSKTPHSQKARDMAKGFEIGVLTK